MQEKVLKEGKMEEALQISKLSGAFVKST